MMSYEMVGVADQNNRTYKSKSQNLPIIGKYKFIK